MPVSEARLVLDKISGLASDPSIHNTLPEVEKESCSDQEKEVLIVKSQPFQSLDLAINPKLSRPQNSSREEGSQPSDDNLSDEDFDFLFCKMLVNNYISSLPKKSTRECPFPHFVPKEYFEDGMSSAAIGEPSHLETNPIFSPFYAHIRCFI